MVWNQGVTEPQVLQNLGLLVARLGRIFLYQKVAQADHLLRTQGIESGLAAAYRVHAYNEVKKSEELLKPSAVQWVEERKDF
jgi:hypothetical protein